MEDSKLDATTDQSRKSRGRTRLESRPTNPSASGHATQSPTRPSARKPFFFIRRARRFNVSRNSITTKKAKGKIIEKKKKKPFFFFFFFFSLGGLNVLMQRETPNNKKKSTAHLDLHSLHNNNNNNNNNKRRRVGESSKSPSPLSLRFRFAISSLSLSADPSHLPRRFACVLTAEIARRLFV